MSQSNPILARTRSHLPRLLALPALAAAAALLVGCGGSTASNAAATEQSREQKAEAQLADFARCMREHGVEATISTGPGGQGHGLSIRGGAGGPAKAEAAQKACKRYQPEPQKVNLSPQQKVEREEAVDKFAKCMREHGIKVEASTQGGGIQIRIHAHPGEEGAPNPESPAFQKSQSTCQKLLPGGPPGGGSGPGKSQSSESGAAVAGG